MPVITHDFESTEEVGESSSLVQSDEWNDAHTLTMPAQTLLGNSGFVEATAEDIVAGEHILLEGGSLSVYGSEVPEECESAVIESIVTNQIREFQYPTWSLGVYDDEFDDENFSGWTTVQDSSPTVTVAEGYDRLTLLHPGGDSAAELHAFMKAVSPAANAMIEMCFRMSGRGQNYNQMGLIFANGASYGAGSQVLWGYSPQETSWVRHIFTNYNSQSGGGVGISCQARMVGGLMFLRFQYLGSNNWQGFASVDGLQWMNISGSFGRTLTPTHIGFWITTWGGVNPIQASIEYFRYIP